MVHSDILTDIQLNVTPIFAKHSGFEVAIEYLFSYSSDMALHQCAAHPMVNAEGKGYNMYRGQVACKCFAVQPGKSLSVTSLSVTLHIY